MNTKPQIFALLSTGFLSLALLAGCETSPQNVHFPKVYQPPVEAMNNAYDAGEYKKAYRLAVRVMSYDQDFSQSQRDNAAFVAGLSAKKMNWTFEAEKNLKRAGRSADPQLAGEAMASLGLMYRELGRDREAVDALLAAAPKLSGQDRANAYYYAAKSQQKLGLWPRARTNFIMARSLSTDPTFRESVEQAMSITGYTLQAGAFSSKDNARETAQKLADRIRIRNLRLPAPTMVPAVDDEGRNLTLVQVGQFHTYHTAEIASKHVGDVIIVPLPGR